jgi:hypothetical protein
MRSLHFPPDSDAIGRLQNVERSAATFSFFQQLWLNVPGRLQYASRMLLSSKGHSTRIFGVWDRAESVILFAPLTSFAS